MKKKNIVVVGHKGHGKDHFCEVLVKYLPELKFASSSLFVAERAVFPTLSKLYGYTTVEECYLDRDNHRPEWYDLIVKYNGPDLTRLGLELFSEYNIYCGLRNINELNALKKIDLIDLVIWVDASERKPLESIKSLTITKEDADIIIDNNSDKESFYKRINNFAYFIK